MLCELCVEVLYQPEARSGSDGPTRANFITSDQHRPVEGKQRSSSSSLSLSPPFPFILSPSVLLFVSSLQRSSVSLHLSIIPPHGPHKSSAPSTSPPPPPFVLLISLSAPLCLVHTGPISFHTFLSRHTHTQAHNADCVIPECLSTLTDLKASCSLAV